MQFVNDPNIDKQFVNDIFFIEFTMYKKVQKMLFNVFIIVKELKSQNTYMNVHLCFVKLFMITFIINHFKCLVGGGGGGSCGCALR